MDDKVNPFVCFWKFDEIICGGESGDAFLDHKEGGVLPIGHKCGVVEVPAEKMVAILGDGDGFFGGERRG